MRIYIAAVLLLSSMGAMWGQTQSAFIKAAEDALLEGNFYAALEYYSEALEFDTSDVSMMYQVADAARQFDSYEKAEEYYTKVIDSDNAASYPNAIYHRAFVQQMQGKYEQARRNYEMYLSEYEDDNTRLTEKARKEIATINWAEEMVLNPEPSITVVNAGPDINSEYSDINPVLGEDQLVFSSVKFYPEDRKKYSDRHIAKVLKGDAAVPSYEISEDFNDDNLHTANVAYNISRSKIFYTICEYQEDGEIRCDIYCRTVNGDGTYGEQKKLPAPINLDSVNTTQPSISFDKETGQEVLYFASDRPGGEGGLDIWVSNITGMESFADPVNVGVVNTPYDEMTPFFHKNSQVLYFSSDGYQTLGGLDIYRSVKDKSVYEKPENLGAPVNSSYNDVYYSLSEDGDKGVMSSNRYGSQYVDDAHKSCCYDIYHVEIGELEIFLNALTFDAKTLDSLEGVTVQLLDASTGALIATITNAVGNDHLFQLERGKEYLLVSSRPGYYPDTLPVNTNTVFKSETLIRKIYLERSSLELQVFTFDEISREALPGTTVILENLTDNTIQEVVLTNENSNDFVFEVIPGHSYRVTAQRDRYYDAFKEFVANDNDGSGIITKELYLTRRDLNVYLPLALYYDNDIPDRRSNLLTTDRTYSETFDDYILKKYEFKDRYSSGLSGSDKELAESRMESFFEDDVKRGYDRYLRFIDYVIGQMQDGHTFDISIRGFASPRADTRYNLALSQRRVVAVQNEIRAYQNGILIPFIENGQLKITELSFGESLAPDNVSDALYDRQNSVYSPEASRERRTEIVEIKQGELPESKN